MARVLTVDGHDLLPYIFKQSYAVSRNDFEGPNTTRTLDGLLHRDYIGYKRKIEVSFRPLSDTEWRFIEHTVLRGKKDHTVIFDDFGEESTATMYQSSFNGVIYSAAPGIPPLRIGAAVNFIEV